MSKVKFTDSNGQDQVEEMVVLGGGTTADGSDAGLVVAEVQQPAGIVTTRTATFSADADMPADETSNANVLAGLVHYTFSSGAKRCRITFHGATSVSGVASINGPNCEAAFCTINAGDDVVAAERLTNSIITGGNTTGEAVDTAKRIVSSATPVIEWDFRGTDATVENVYIIGIPTGATPTTTILPVFVNVEVW